MRFYAPFKAIIITCTITFALNASGLLKFSEFLVYDAYLRSRPPENIDNSIIIVGIKEKDIDAFEFPLQDKTLANLLLKIKQGNPSVIGIDLHRKGSFGEGEDKLKNVLKSSDNIIGVEKTDGGNPQNETIPAHKILKEKKLVGASQIIEDTNNGIVRRGYLYVNQSDVKKSVPSFGLMVALKYLKNREIYPSITKNGELKLKKSIFPNLDRNFFYHYRQIDGYQTLLSYRSLGKQYNTISISEVLEDKVDTNAFKNKVVFIGTVAETVDDLYLTPYNSVPQNSNFVFGVEIHAGLTEQIIQAAINNSVIISPINLILAYGLIFLYLVATSFLSWHLFIGKYDKHQQIHFFLYFLSSLAFPFGCGYVLLEAGYWIPVTTMFITSFISGSIIYIYLLQNRNEISEIELEKARKLLLSDERLKVYDKSISLMAHEIKNILNILQSSADLAKNAVDNIESFIDDISILFESEDLSNIDEYISEINEELSVVIEESCKITKTIDRIKAECSDQPVPNQPDKEATLNLIDSLERNLRLLEQGYRSKNKSIKLNIIKNFQLNQNNQIVISLELERAIANIIENAFYFATKKNEISDDNWVSEIKVSLREKDNDIELKIKDNGIGIQGKDLSNIFTDFWSTKPKGEGMGLGLYIAMKSIQKLNGSITVFSDQDITEFTVLFPKNQQI